MTIAPAGTHGSSAAATWVWVDAFDVTASATAPVATPTPNPAATPTPAPVSAPSSAGASRIEQNSSSVTYSGAWYPNNSAFNSGGSSVMGIDASSSATVTFTGTSVSWIGFSDPWSGIAHVYVDGSLVATVDTYSPVQLAQKVQYTASNLTSGTHTMTVSPTSGYGSGSAAAWVWVDAFNISSAGSPVVPAATPSTPTVTPASKPSTPSTATTTRVQQDGGTVKYAGQWFTNNGAFNSGGSAAMSSDPSSSATIGFTGTGIKWIGFGDQWSGIAHVYIDGVLTATVDTFAIVQAAQTVLYNAGNLTNGAHTMMIVPTGLHNASSSANWIWLDAFDVTSVTTN